MLTDDYCPLLYMQGDVGNLADYLIKRGVIIKSDCEDCASKTTRVIDKLHGEIAKLRKVQKWIPVTERLPELHTKVLCCGIKGGRFIAELGTWGHENHLYWDKKDGKGCPTVTHWMPLPEPPKGE